MQALITRGVIGVSAPATQMPDILASASPLYLSFEDVGLGQHLVQVLDSEEWKRPEFNQKQAVT